MPHTPQTSRSATPPHVPAHDASDAFIRRAGRQLIFAMYGALRAVKLYPVENAAVQKALAELTAQSREVIDGEGELELRMSGEFIFVNQTRLRLDLDNFASFSHLLALFRAAGIGTMAVAEPVGPLGMWMTEKKEGRVRIEECGTNLCGYSVDARTNENKEKVLINMKPAGSKWTGKIYDPKSGSTYSSTIAMKGKDGLRVQGCAFGGMFCGGQTWTRTN